MDRTHLQTINEELQEDFVQESLHNIRSQHPELLINAPEWVNHPKAPLTFDPWIVNARGDTFSVDYLFMGNSGLRFTYIDRRKLDSNFEPKWIGHFTPDGYGDDVSPYYSNPLQLNNPNPTKYGLIYGASICAALEFYTNDWAKSGLTKPNVIRGSTNPSMYEYRVQLLNELAPGSFIPNQNQDKTKDQIRYIMNIQQLAQAKTEAEQKEQENSYGLLRINKIAHKIKQKYEMTNPAMRVLSAYVN